MENQNNNEKQHMLQDEATARNYYLSLIEERIGKSETPWSPHELSAIPIWTAIRSGFFYPLQWRPIGSLTWTWGEFIIILILLPGLIGVTALGDDEGSGAIATVPFALTFALASRNSVFTFLLGIPFERALLYHKVCALSALGAGIVHGIIAGFGEDESLTGIILTGIFGGLIVTSLPPIRRYFFEVFLYLHWILLGASVVFAFIHEATIFVWGLGLYVFDIAVRIYLSSCRNPHKVTIVRCPSDVVRITFPKDSFTYKPGQYMFICIPSLGFFQWHPFSISSAPWEPDVSIHLRVLGNWTKQLYELAGDETKEVTAFMEGPYGEPVTDVEGDRYKCFLLVSGGIGVTPMQSIFNQLLYEYARGRKIVKIWFVYAVRDKFMIDSVLAYNSQYYELKLNKGRLPKSFSPDLLLTHGQSIRGDEHFQNGSDLEKEHNTGVGHDENDADPVHSEFYLTKVRDLKEFDMAGIDPSLQRSLRFGRPKLPLIFDKMKEIAIKAGENKVAALCCGPNVMIQEMISLSKSKSDNKVKFDVHHETFEF